MITTTQWIHIAYVMLAPMGLLLINTADFLVKGKEQRGQFMYLEQHGVKNYLTVHCLLVLGIALNVVSWLWKPASPAFQVAMATWFMWINIHAMISRRKKNQQTGAR